MSRDVTEHFFEIVRDVGALFQFALIIGTCYHAVDFLIDLTADAVENRSISSTRRILNKYCKKVGSSVKHCLSFAFALKTYKLKRTGPFCW